MSWKCDICDSYNDERETACFVCGQARSAVSIREGKIRAREERMLRLNNAVFKTGYKISNVMFLVGLISSLVILVVATILKLVQGNIDALLTNLLVLLEHMGVRFINTVPFNAYVILESLMSAPYADVGYNVEYTASVWRSALSIISVSIQEIFINTAKNNFEQSCISCVEYLISLFCENISNTLAVLKQLQDSVIRQISDILDIIKSVFQNVRQYF